MNKCQVILQSGVRKGLECGLKGIGVSNQCNRHNKIWNIETKGAIVLDIETESFTCGWLAPEPTKTIYDYPLRIRVAVVYSYDEGKYHTFFSHQLIEFFEMVANAAHVITYNGEGFDFEVMRVNGFDSEISNSIDICKLLYLWTGKRDSLDRRVNKLFGLRKQTKGREMCNLAGDELAKACLIDVELTKKLYEYPKYWSNKRTSSIGKYGHNSTEYTDEELRVFHALKMSREYTDNWMDWAKDHLAKVIISGKLIWINDETLRNKIILKLYDNFSMCYEEAEVINIKSKLSKSIELIAIKYGYVESAEQIQLYAQNRKYKFLSNAGVLWEKVVGFDTRWEVCDDYLETPLFSEYIKLFHEYEVSHNQYNKSKYMRWAMVNQLNNIWCLPFEVFKLNYKGDGHKFKNQTISNEVVENLLKKHIPQNIKRRMANKSVNLIIEKQIDNLVTEFVNFVSNAVSGEDIVKYKNEFLDAKFTNSLVNESWKLYEIESNLRMLIFCNQDGNLSNLLIPHIGAYPQLTIMQELSNECLESQMQIIVDKIKKFKRMICRKKVDTSKMPDSFFPTPVRLPYWVQYFKTHTLSDYLILGDVARCTRPN